MCTERIQNERCCQLSSYFVVSPSLHKPKTSFCCLPLFPSFLLCFRSDGCLVPIVICEFDWIQCCCVSGRDFCLEWNLHHHKELPSIKRYRARLKMEEFHEQLRNLATSHGTLKWIFFLSFPSVWFGNSHFAWWITHCVHSKTSLCSAWVHQLKFACNDATPWVTFDVERTSLEIELIWDFHH